MSTVGMVLTAWARADRGELWWDALERAIEGDERVSDVDLPSLGIRLEEYTCGRFGGDLDWAVRELAAEVAERQAESESE